MAQMRLAAQPLPISWRNFTTKVKGKTGTLTSDELICVGLGTGLKSQKVKKTVSPGSEGNNGLLKMNEVNSFAKLVIAGCHTLFAIPAADEDESEATNKEKSKVTKDSQKKGPIVQGDPMELAAFKSIQWTISPSSDSEANDDSSPDIKPDPRKKGRNIDIPSKSSISSVKILHRHHFNSTLQRMSCVIKCNNALNYVVSKGSPEAIYNNCLKGSKNMPDSHIYHRTAQELAKSGLRVIALATKSISNEQITECTSDRAVCENSMDFAGFLCFGCQVRKDTKVSLDMWRICLYALNM